MPPHAIADCKSHCNRTLLSLPPQIHELGEKDYASSLPAMANPNNKGALITLANMAIVEDISLENGDDDKEVGNGDEFNFGEAPSNDHINSVVDDIHRNQD
jgi:hypothetical protein